MVFDADPASPGYGAVSVPLGMLGLRDAGSRPATEAGWDDVLAVYTVVDDATVAPVQPVLGRHAVADGRLTFTPEFPPVPGQAYRIRVQAGGTPFDTIVTVTRAARPPSTRVVQVYPSADTLPENLLRLYIEFTAPMSAGEAARRIRLLDEAGEPVTDAFLVTPEELWDPERRRLTVLFDPGRIKREVLPNRELGPPLRAGGTYTLAIEDAWLDGEGLPLREGFRKRFFVGPADRAIPSAADWRVGAPRAGTSAAVTLDFPEPLDWGLLGRLLAVHTAAGAAVAGQVSTMANETRWSFTPHAPWAAGDYVIEVRTELEDVAGNNLRAPFDVDRSAPRPVAPTGESIGIPFTVR